MERIKPYFIGICGGSASGKTSVAHTIAHRVNGEVPIVSLDWYYLPLEDKSTGPTHNWDHPDAFDWNLLSEHFDAWSRGESVWAPEHDYQNYDQKYNVREIHPAPVIIFEGILALANDYIRNKLDLKVYVKCDGDVAYRRRVKRDVTHRGYGREEVDTRYFEHVKPMFQKYIEPAEKLADIILFNNGHNDVINDYIEHKGVDHIIEAVKYKLIKPKLDRLL